MVDNFSNGFSVRLVKKSLEESIANKSKINMAKLGTNLSHNLDHQEREISFCWVNTISTTRQRLYSTRQVLFVHYAKTGFCKVALRLL